MHLSSIVGWTWGWFPSPSRSPTSRRIQRWQKQLWIIPVVPQPLPSLASFGTGVVANLLWVKLPPGSLHQWRETPALLNMGKHSFFSWTPNFYVLSRLPEGFLLRCRQKSNTSWAMEEITCGQGEVATWVHWFLFSQPPAFLAGTSRITHGPGELLYGSVPHLCLWYSSSLHHKAKGFTAGERSAKAKRKADAWDCSARHLLTLTLSCKNQQSGCLLLALQNRCNLRR